MRLAGRCRVILCGQGTESIQYPLRTAGVTRQQHMDMIRPACGKGLLQRREETADAALDTLLQIRVEFMDRDYQLAGHLTALAVEKVQELDTGLAIQLSVFPQRAQPRHEHHGIG